MLETLTAGQFEPLLQSKFRIVYGENRFIEVTLFSIQCWGPSPAEDDRLVRQPFTLLFREDGARHYLPQRIYRLAHEQLGEFEVFICPKGPDGSGMVYEIVFS